MTREPTSNAEELFLGRFVIRVSSRLTGQAALRLGELVVVARQPTSAATLALARQVIALAGDVE